MALVFNRPILQQETVTSLPLKIVGGAQRHGSETRPSRPPSATAWRSSAERPSSAIGCQSWNGAMMGRTSPDRCPSQCAGGDDGFAEGSGRFGELLQMVSSEHQRVVSTLQKEVNNLQKSHVSRRPSANAFAARTSIQSSMNQLRAEPPQEFRRPSQGSSEVAKAPAGAINGDVIRAVQQLRDEKNKGEETKVPEEPNEPLIMTPVMPVTSQNTVKSSVNGECKGNGEGNGQSEADPEAYESIAHDATEVFASEDSPSFGSTSSSGSDIDEVEKKNSLPARSLCRKTSLIINGTDFNKVLEDREFELWPVWEGLPVRHSEAQGKDQHAGETHICGTNHNFRGATSMTLVAAGSSGLALAILQRFVTHPRSRWRILWNLLALIVIGFDIVMVPFEVFEPPETRFTASLALSTQLFWNLDIAFNFFVGYWDQAAVIMNIKKIAKNYVCTWLCVDLFLVILDWFVLGFTSLSQGTDSGAASFGRLGKSVRYFRFLRSFRLLRLLKMRELLERAQWSFMSDVVSVRFGIGKMLLVILIINHLLACAWYGIGKLAFEGRSWLDDFEDTSLQYRYTTAFHWSVAQFGVGTAELDAFNTGERAFSIIVGLFALMTFSSIVSSITNLMSHLSQLNDRNRHFAIFRRYCAEHNVSKELSHRMSQYIEYALEHQKRSVASCDVRLLSLLSEPLYDELQKEIYEPHFLVHPLFLKLCKFYAVAMRAVCRSAVGTMFLAPRDVLFRPRQVASKMYLIVGGKLQYEKEGVFDEITTPSFFSEAVLWTPWLFLGLMEATTPTELVGLEAHEFAECIKMHPATFARVKRYATQYLDDLRKTPHPERTDLCLEPETLQTFQTMNPRELDQGWLSRIMNMIKRQRVAPRLSDRESIVAPDVVSPEPAKEIAGPQDPAPKLPDPQLSNCSSERESGNGENKVDS